MDCMNYASAGIFYNSYALEKRFEIWAERNTVQTNAKLSIFTYGHKHYETSINPFRNIFKRHFNEAL
jgi:hypothetical protein